MVARYPLVSLVQQPGLTTWPRASRIAPARPYSLRRSTGSSTEQGASLAGRRFASVANTLTGWLRRLRANAEACVQWWGCTRHACRPPSRLGCARPSPPPRLLGRHAPPARGRSPAASPEHGQHVHPPTGGQAGGGLRDRRCACIPYAQVLSGGVNYISGGNLIGTGARCGDTEVTDTTDHYIGDERGAPRCGVGVSGGYQLKKKRGTLAPPTPHHRIPGSPLIGVHGIIRLRRRRA